MEEDRLMQSMLLDFYGALLTDKQRECFHLHCNEDLSLSEIAEQCGISRQGVWDNIRRAEQSLTEIEEKTGLIRRFTENQQKLACLSAMADRLEEITRDDAKVLAGELASLIKAMKAEV